MYLGGLAVSTDIRDRELSVSVTRSSEYASVDGVMDQLRFVVRNIGDNVSSVIWNRPGHRSANYTGRMLDPVTGLLVAGGICIALIIGIVALPAGKVTRRSQSQIADFKRVFNNRPVMINITSYFGHLWEVFSNRVWIVTFLVFAEASQPGI